ncbi:MAG: hypothetical protein RLZZ352_486 [Pseudomonadota bacterium]|jgi:biopolymer transport protein TolR
MARSPQRRTRRTRNEINMVPFIDVMLVLLIIFMVTAPLITPGQIDLPSVGQANRTPDAYVEVLIDRDQTLQARYSQKPQVLVPVNAGQLVSRVKELSENKPQMPVLISADKQVKYEAVMDVVRQLRAAGIQRVALSTL